MREKKTMASKDLSIRVKQLRKLKEWSQGQLAKKLGVEYQRISKYERGVIFPTVDMMIRLSEAFGVSLDFLIKGENEPDLKNLPNMELVKRLDQIGYLSEEDQKALILVMDAFIKKQRFESVAKS